MMTLLIELAAMLSLGSAFAMLLLAFIGHVVVPAVTLFSYRVAHTGRGFVEASGDQGAGSADIVYFSAYYDVTRSDALIRLPAPAAPYWQFGAFDGRMRQLDRGHLNSHTALLGEDGQITIRLTKRASAEANTLVCGDDDRGLLIYRVLLATKPVAAPSFIANQRH